MDATQEPVCGPDNVGVHETATSEGGKDKETIDQSFHVIIVRGGLSHPEINTYSTSEELITALRDLYKRAVNDVILARAKLFVFQGQRLAITGDPIRSIKLQDGTIHALVDDLVIEDDNASILPPSRR